jgi:hypothetical protein
VSKLERSLALAAHQIAINKQPQRWEQFMRNGRWGTCVDCPTDNNRRSLPELCVNTDRYDHNLTLDELVEQYKRFVKKGT